MNPLAVFFDLYFAFVISGNVMDFQEANLALTQALGSGATLDEIQECMDSSHTSVELLAVIHDVIREDYTNYA